MVWISFVEGTGGGKFWLIYGLWETVGAFTALVFNAVVAVFSGDKASFWDGVFDTNRDAWNFRCDIFPRSAITNG